MVSSMFENMENMFDGMQIMMKKLKKYSYEKNMEVFREKNNKYFSEMIEYIKQAENKKQAAEEIAVCFAGKVENHFTVNGKIKGRTQADLNFFMIYYTFPAILLTENPDAETIAQAICTEWGSRFKDSKIGYANYNRIHDAFREKIFGIF